MSDERERGAMFRCTQRPYPTVRVRDGTKVALVSFVRGGVLDPSEAAPRIGVRAEALLATLRSLPEYGVTIFEEGAQDSCQAAATPPPAAEEGAAQGPAPSSPLACPHCGREDFKGRRGLARHISAMHPEAAR